MACFSHHCELSMQLGILEGPLMAFAEPGVEPNYAPSREVKLEHVEIRLFVDPKAKAFDGRATFHFRALPGFTGELRLDVDDVTIDSVECDGESLSWVHLDDVLQIAGATDGQPITVVWHGDGSKRGMYFTGPEVWAPEREHMAWSQCQDEDAHFMMPCHDHPRIKYSWSIRLEGPRGYTLLSNGEMVDSGETEDRAWVQYEQREPMPAYLFTAVVAPLACVEAQWRGRSVRYLVPIGDEGAIARSMGKTPLMMECFSQRTGVDYPWPRYDQVVVHDFVFGGMENTACTTMTDLLLVDERAILEWDPDGLVAHELAHQWFGDLVTMDWWTE